MPKSTNLDRKTYFCFPTNHILRKYWQYVHIFAFIPWKSTYIDPNLLWPLSYHVKDLFFRKRQQARPRSFIILSCQIFAYFAYFAYFTPLTSDNFWTRLFWNHRSSPISLLYKFSEIHLVILWITKKFLNLIEATNVNNYILSNKNVW